jgi:hypothetical protein
MQGCGGTGRIASGMATRIRTEVFCKSKAVALLRMIPRAMPMQCLMGSSSPNR